jgi:ubiquinone/menaquinone biosynthesis C-methylase UbiE
LKDNPLNGWKDKRKIMQRYNTTADSYDEQYGEEQARKYKKALEHVNVEDKAVLDVGCGSGLFFREVADKAIFVVGVDISHKLLMKAQKNASKFPNVFVLQADADNLPFEAGLFDAVFSFTVLQNMPQPTQTIQELGRVAKINGRVAVTGLKKAFSLEKFMEVLEGSDLRLDAFADDEAINCYVAVLT